MEKNYKGITAYIDEKDLLEREKLICFLEKEGFLLDADEFRGRQGIIEDSLPVTVDLAKRTYQMMGNVTSAAGAASSGRIMMVEKFYESYDQIKLEVRESYLRRVETDCIGRSIDITKVTFRRVPWTREEAERAREENKKRSVERKNKKE